MVRSAADSGLRTSSETTTTTEKDIPCHCCALIIPLKVPIANRHLSCIGKSRLRIKLEPTPGGALPLRYAPLSFFGLAKPLEAWLGGLASQNNG